MSKSNSNVTKKRKLLNDNDQSSFIVSSSTGTKLRKRKKQQQILSTPTINIISTTTTTSYTNGRNNKGTSSIDDKFNFVPSHQQQQQQQSATSDDYDDLLADCLEEMESSIFSSQSSLPTSVQNATSSSSITTNNENSHTTSISSSPSINHNNNTDNNDDNGTKTSDLLWFVPTIATTSTSNTMNDCYGTNSNQLTGHQYHPQQKQKQKQKLNKLLIDKIQTWNQDMIYYSSINSNTNSSSTKKKKRNNNLQQQHYTRIYNYGYFVPSFDVEMTRHFQIESLSKFVLESVSKTTSTVSTTSTASTANHGTQLRIPTFERWLLDSKQEEKERGLSVLRNMSTTTSTVNTTSKKSSSSASSSPFTYYDPILPCCNFNQLMTMKATHRLMEEIQQVQQVQQKQQQQQGTNTTINSNQSREVTKQIVQDLCRKTLNAVQTIAQQYNMYSMNQQQLSSSPFRKGDRIIMKTTTTTIPTPDSNNNSNLNHDNNKIDEGSINNNNVTNEKSATCYYTLEYHRDKKWKKPFSIKINKSHYDKLQCMFLYVHNKYHGNKKVSTTTPLSFYEISTKTGQEQSTMTLHIFHLLVMVLTIRYSSLSGGQLLFTLRGGGMQGAVHNDLFHVLHDYFVSSLSSSSSSSSSVETQVPILRECFASPFNAYLMSSYTSAFFDDIDWHFGSIGNFFTNSMIPAAVQDNNDRTSNIIVPEEGCYQLNPPFSPGIMTSMANQINTILRKANEQNKALTFVVIVPSVDIGSSNDNVKANESTNNNSVVEKTLTSTTEERTDVSTKLLLPASKRTTTTSNDSTKVESIVKRFCAVSFRRLIHNEYCTVHIQIPAYEHGYIEGSQHLRPTRYKESSYDTSVIILQSNMAKQLYQSKENNTCTTSTNENKLASLVSNIRTAFASRHHSELTLRRQNKKQVK